MWPGTWSLRHRELARSAAERNWQRKADPLRAHPAAQFVGLPLLIGVLASFRAAELWAHPTVSQRVLLGLAGGRPRRAAAGGDRSGYASPALAELTVRS